MNGGEVTKFIDRERLRRHLSQDRLSEMAGYIDGGQCYRRMWARMDARTNTHEKFLNAMGYTLKVVPIEEAEDEKQGKRS